MTDPEPMQERIAQMLKSGSPTAPAWALLGLRPVAAEPGRAVVAMICREDMRNHQGVIHGGLLGTLADSAMGLAMATVLPEGERHFSFDLKVNFVTHAEVGDHLLANAGVVHHGRRTGVAECRIERDGNLVSTATASFILYLPKDSDVAD